MRWRLGVVFWDGNANAPHRICWDDLGLALILFDVTVQNEGYVLRWCSAQRTVFEGEYPAM